MTKPSPDANGRFTLLDVRFDMVGSAVWLLFYCRGALQIEMGNTAALVVRSVSSFQWSGQSRGPRTWRAVVGWEPRVEAGGWILTAHLNPGGRLEIAGAGAEFYVGDVPGCDDAPPDFLDATDEELRTGLAGWSSEFKPVHASFLDPRP